MKKMLLFSITTLVSISSFAVTRGDIETAFSFVYSRSAEDRTAEQKQVLSDLYLAVTMIENKCYVGELSVEFCNSKSISDTAIKMETIHNEQDAIIARTAQDGIRTAEMIEQVKALETQRVNLGESLVKTVTDSLSTLGLK